MLRCPRGITDDQHVPFSERLPAFPPRVLEVQDEPDCPGWTSRGSQRKSPKVPEAERGATRAHSQFWNEFIVVRQGLEANKKPGPSQARDGGQTNQTVILVNDRPSVSRSLEGDKVQLANVYPVRRSINSPPRQRRESRLKTSGGRISHLSLRAPESPALG